ncbi:MAG: toxin-antitoxin system YwqK family antitoxin [Vicingaceae bacterium]
MKRSLFLLLFFSLLSPVFSQSFELVDGDTINYMDENRRRQGMWIVKAKAAKHPGFQVGQVVEEGEYKNSRKVGLWKEYFPNGNLKSKITYNNSRPMGPYTLYYENGKVQEEGNWQRTKNTGDFKRYHPNGQVAQEFTFTDDGRRNGKQKYYYPNGQLQLEGDWQGGQESGELKMYYENGDLMEVKYFNDGVMDQSKFQTFAPKTPQEDPLKKQMDAGKDVKVEASKTAEKPNIGGFDGNGYAKLYNPNKQISKDGEFENYRLMDGKYYRYNDDGILTQIMIFKNGKYIGDGVIEED